MRAIQLAQHRTRGKDIATGFYSQAMGAFQDLIIATLTQIVGTSSREAQRDRS
jgi:hypothetical protein